MGENEANPGFASDDDDLPYSVCLSYGNGARRISRARTIGIAAAIYNATCDEFPGAKVMLIARERVLCERHCR